MKMISITYFAAVLLASCGAHANSAPVQLIAQEDPQVPSTVVFDKTVHDFGDVSVSDGPLTCSFTLTNNGDTPITIYEVVSSCGCTDVQWTKGSIEKGESGSISATYKNTDGAMPFDKTLTVYMTGIKRPVVLRLRGVVHEKKKSLQELYGKERIGDLGLKARQFKTSALKQGQSTSETATVANLGKKPLDVQFAQVSEHMRVAVTPNPIPSGSTATLSFTIESSPDIYGRETYHATPVLNGKSSSAAIEVSAFTQENFDNLSKDDRNSAALPYFDNSTVSFDSVHSGEKIEVEFFCTNKGKKSLHFYKADGDVPGVTAVALPDIASGKKETLRFSIDTASLPKGENVIMVSLTTNSPLRPILNIFIAGVVL